VTNAVYHLLYGRADGHEEASLSIFRLSVIDGFRLYDVPSCSCFQNLCSCFGDSAHAFSPSIKCQVGDPSTLIASHGLDRRPFPLFLRFPSAFPSPPRLASKSSQTCRLLLRLGSHPECWAQMMARYVCMRFCKECDVVDVWSELVRVRLSMLILSLSRSSTSPRYVLLFYTDPLHHQLQGLGSTYTFSRSRSQPSMIRRLSSKTCSLSSPPLHGPTLHMMNLIPERDEAKEELRS
jgi:hypothetical protein